MLVLHFCPIFETTTGLCVYACVFHDKMLIDRKRLHKLSWWQAILPRDFINSSICDTCNGQWIIVNLFVNSTSISGSHNTNNY